jgi:hypothetical protein
MTMEAHMNRISTRILSLTLPVFAIMMPAVSARANTSPGAMFKAAYASQASCINVSSYGQLVNNCSYSVLVEGSVPVTENAWHATSVSIAGNNSWCQTVTINGVGNGANVGNQVWTSAGPVTWQTLDTGARYVWSTMGVAFRCGLEPNGAIGLFTAN